MIGTKATPENVESWRKLWDPENFLTGANLPILWVTGTNDFAFTLRAWQLSYRAAPGPHTLCLRERMKHGHNGPWETPEEMCVFADSITRQGMPLAIISKPEQNGKTAVSTYAYASPIKEASLNFTCDSGTWQQRKRESVPAQLAPDPVSAAVPETATAYFFTLKDGRGLLVTSEHVSATLPEQPSSSAPLPGS